MKKVITLLTFVFLWAANSWGQTVLLSPTGEGGFEAGGSLALNNWSQKNNIPAGGVDVWYTSSLPVPSAGTNCGFVSSSSAGTTWAYLDKGFTGSQNIMHLYHDVTIPANQAVIVISFKWKAQGEGALPIDADNLKVFFAPSTVNPAASSPIPSIYRIGQDFYNLSSAAWNNSGDITVIGTAGTTYRIIFSWYSNEATIANPPAAIDEVSVTSYPTTPADAAPTNFTATGITGTSMTVGWTDNSTNELGFRVYRSTDNINFTKVGADIPSNTIAGVGTTYSLVQTGLLPASTYFYRVAAYYALESPYLTGNATTNTSTLSGIRTVGGAGTPDYPTIAAAIADLNTQGVAPGGVTFNVAASHTEIFQTATAGHITTTSGSVSRPIVFQKSGSGANPLITAPVGIGTSDAIIAISGCDYITFDGINLTENPANLTAATLMEYGYAIVKAIGIGTDGAQNITIKNCSISLNTTSVVSTGIFSGNITMAQPTVQLPVTNLAGTNSYLKINNNTINCYNGISLNGYNDPVAETLLDQGNEIGKDGANSITNIAGAPISTQGYGILGMYQNNIKIANNSVTSTMGGASSGIYGIALMNGRNSSFDLYNNTVSLQYSGSGTAIFFPIHTDMGISGVTNTINVYNNTVTGCTFPTYTSGTVRFINLNNLGVTANIYGNTISNNSVGDMALPSTGSIMHLVCGKNSNVFGPMNIYNNTITGNQRKTASPGTMPVTFISATGSTTMLMLYSNTVSNNIVRATANTTMISASTTQGSEKIYDNLISNITEANGTTYGINFSNSSSNIKAEVYRNTIQNIEGSTSTTRIHGIYMSVSGASSLSYIYNNMISDLRAPNALGTGTVGDCLTGIYITSTNFLSVYNNSVYLNGTSTGAIFGTSAFYSVTSGLSTDLRNNIFVNTSTPNGTGLTAAVRFTNVSWNNVFAQTSNNNLVFAGTPGVSNLLFTDGTNKDQTLMAYQTRLSPRETQSVTEMPPFVSTTIGSSNLHLQTSVATQCESGGSVIAGTFTVTSDIDNNLRYPNPGFPVGTVAPYAPDLGADEFGGIPNDLTAPLITFTPLAPTDVTTSRTLAVTITDSKGVPVLGIGLPKLYWKINSGAYTAAPDPAVAGSVYTFTFGGGAVTGDVISYYVVAQDIETSPNVTSRPFVGAAGYTANPPACAIPPTTPNSYTIINPFTGIYHVGVGKDYATLTLAAAAVNTRTLTGPVTFILDDATYPSETIPIVFNANAGSSATNTVTIKPLSGVSPVISYASATAVGIIELNGIDYFTIDGSNNGTNSKNLTVINSKTLVNGTCAIALKSTATDPATNVTIKNCILKSVRVETASTSNNTSAIRFISAGSVFDNCVIDNNIINASYNGVQLWGWTMSAPARNIQITNNTIGSTVSADAVSGRGIDIQNADNTLVLNNEIMGPADGSINKGQVGIQLGSGSYNTKIRRNSIHTMVHPADDGGACYGIYSATDASTVTEISNNLIYDLRNGGSQPFVHALNTYGIFFNSGGNARIIHNTINLSGAFISSSKNASSACIAFMNTVTGGNFEIRNNIFRNGMTLTGAPAVNGKAYGIMMAISPSQISAINHNNYFIDGYNGAIAQFYPGSLTTLVDFSTLASWQAFSGQDANSLNLDPVFTTPANLIPTSAPMNNKAGYLAEFPTDFAGITRYNPTDMGAYDYAVNIADYHTLQATDITKVSATLNGDLNTNNEVVEAYFQWGLTTSYGNTVNAAGLGTPPNLQSSSLTALNASISGLAPNTTYHFRLYGIPKTSGQSPVTGNDMTFTTLPLAPVVVTTAATALSSTGAQLNGTVNPNGVSAIVTIQYGLTTAYGSTVAATPGTVTGTSATNIMSSVTGLLPLSTYHYRVVASNFNETTYGNDMTFTTLPTPATVTTLPATNIVAGNAKLNGSVNANNQTNTVSFEWGLTTAYGNTVAGIPATVAGTSTTSVSANLTGLTYATVYHFRCVATGPGGTIYGSDMVFTSDCPLPATPGAITGLQSVCRNTSNVTYSISPVPEATSYIWTVPTGATITAGSTTNTVTVSYSTTAVSGNVTVAAISGCGTGSPASLPVTVHVLPVPVVSGPASACINSSGNIYTTQTGMTNYVWSVTGGTITSGAGTNSITVTWNTSGAQSVSINYNNSNGCSAIAPVTYPVTVNTLPAAPVITGPNVACESTLYLDYSCQPGMTTYVWDMSPNSGTITQTGTNVVTIFWTSPGAKWVSVSYTNANGCTSAAPTVYNVTVNPLPAAPGAITGTAIVCAGATAVAYSVPAVSGATGYVWTLPAGATIASGAGTRSITVNYSANASSGNLTVVAQNACGDGPASPAYAVTVNQIPAAAGAITGTSTVCQGTNGVTYSVATVTGATSYNWTLPTGATVVTGANTNTITVNYSLSAESGPITVSGVNDCGTGTSSVMTVTVNVKPATPVITLNGNILSSSSATGNQWYKDGVLINGATAQTYTILQDGTYTVVVTLNGCSSEVSNAIIINHTGVENSKAEEVNVYPNPNRGMFWITINTEKTEIFDMQVLNSVGTIVHQESNLEVNGTFKQQFDLHGLAAGMYTVVLRSETRQIIRKIVVNK